MDLELIGDNLIANAIFLVLGLGIWFIKNKFKRSRCQTGCCTAQFGTERSGSAPTVSVQQV